MISQPGKRRGRLTQPIRMLQSPLRTALDAVLAVVWAPRCAACNDLLQSPAREVVCGNCWRRISCLRSPVCDRCGAEVASGNVATGILCGNCETTGGPPTARRAAGVHAGTLREIVHAFKYEGRRSLARPLAALVRSAAGDWLREADVAVPVPLHAFRRWRRGFNQAHDLASNLGLPVLPALRRRRHTDRQVDLSRARRLNALRHAFAPVGGRRGHPIAAALRGRSVVLVDDVITTGATVEACASVLRGAGAREVRAVSVALAVAARSQPPSPPRRHPAPARRRCAPSRAAPPDGDSSPAPG